MSDFLSNINQFAADHRWVFWPIVGAVVTTIFNIRKIGFKNFINGNHPVQAILGMLILGGLIGLLMAWITKIIFH